jgi:hypothetical protein
MRIFFLTSAHNSLSQRLETQLTERGHEIRARKWRQPKKTFVAAHEERCKAAIRMIAGCLASQPRQPTKLLTETICRIMLPPCCLSDASPQFSYQFAESGSFCHENSFPDLRA